jgi:hypothetical protein
MEEVKSLIKQLSVRTGADKKTVNDFMRRIGVTLPMDYIRFMLFSNGTEGPIGDTEYVRIWSTAEVEQFEQRV